MEGIMKKYWKWIRSLMLALFCCGGMASATSPTEEEMFRQFEVPKQKKTLLAQVWMDRTPDVILKHLEFLKQTFDGVFIELYGYGHKDPRGEVASSRRICQKDFAFQYEWFEAEIPKLQTIAAGGLKHSFIGTALRYGDLDWFNDEHWRIACANYGLLAKIAREGGIKGIEFDCEMYAEKLFNYQPDCGKSRHEVWLKARERGRQWMSEVQENYPGITVFCLFLHSLNYELLGTPDNNAYAQGNLFVPFLNGMLDAIAPTTKLIEGNEFYTYKASSKRHFDFALERERELFNAQVLPENRAKAKAQIDYAPAIYIDAYFYEQKNASPYYLAVYDVMSPRLAWDDPARMKAVYLNFPEAFRRSDEYVWFYQERCRYWDANPKYLDNRLLQDAFPQLLPFLSAVRSPDTLERYWLERVQGEKLPNLVMGGDFEDDSYKKWHFWQRAKNDHEESGFFLAPGDGVNGSRGIVAKNLGKHGGSFFVKNLLVKPGAQYLLYGKIRRTEAGYGALTIMFQQSPEAWDYNTLTPLIKVAPRTMAAGDYEEVIGVFTMPDYVPMVGVCCSVAEQRNLHDFVFFDEIGLYELPMQ